jgi:hypothetical protein
MGMENDSTSFWKQMYNAHAIQSRAFSMCYSRPVDADRSGTEAGAMTLGGSDERLHDTDLVFASLQKGSAFFAIHLRKMYLREGGGGDSALPTKSNLKYRYLAIGETQLNQGQVIVDSGTTDTYFTRAVQQEFKSAWKELTGHDFSTHPMKLSSKELRAMPSLVLQFTGDIQRNEAVRVAKNGQPVVGLADSIDPDNPNDLIWVIPPTHFFEYDPEDGKYTARLYLDEARGSVLGGNAMMGHDILFDVDNFILGVAESSCDYTSLVESHYNITLIDRGDGSNLYDDDSTMNDDASDDGEFPMDGEGSVNEEVAGVCSSIQCQLSFVAVAVLLVAVGAVIALRRTSAGIEYSLPGELELQGTDEYSRSSMNGNGHNGLDGPAYRTHRPIADASFDSEDSGGHEVT